MYDNSELKKGDVFYIVDKGLGVRKCKVLKKTVKSESESSIDTMIVEWKNVGDKRKGYRQADVIEKGKFKYYFKEEKEAVECFNKDTKKLNQKLDNIEYLLNKLFEKAFESDKTMECFQYRLAIEKYIGSLKEDESKEIFKDLKKVTKREVENILNHPEKKEDLMDLKSVIITMRDTYGTITQNQAEVLLNPIEEAGDRFYNEYMEETGNNRDIK